MGWADILVALNQYGQEYLNVKRGITTHRADVLDQVNLATVNFATNACDPRAVIITSYNCLLGQVNAPSPPKLSALSLAYSPAKFLS